ncbi:MAG TPA: hypothetical protein VMV92_11430 [Streptosporangiaceae bacterium]|nr:hypothetical protein [Streptosporangiaceae bacterium]
MEPGWDEQVAHLQRLAGELGKRGFTAQLGGGTRHASLRAANPATPQLTERVLCETADDGSWCYWWPWRQPIGSVDDVGLVADKITAVLRSVGGQP